MGALGKRDLIFNMNKSLAVLSFYDVSNLGNVVIEALSGGSLVISLNDGSLNGIISDQTNGFLVKSMDEAANLIINLLENPETQKRVRIEASRSAANLFLTWEERIEQELQLIYLAGKRYDKMD